MHDILKNNVDNYNLFQLVLPLNLEINFKKCDEVVTFCDIIKGVDLKKYFKNVGKSFIGRPLTNRVAILKTILFGFMIGIRSTRKLKEACKYDTRFMYLLQNTPVPSHATIGNVIKELNINKEDIFVTMLNRINDMEKNKIDFDTVFVDGTKIEADANKYSFVWRGSVNYHLVNLIKNINVLVKDISNYAFEKDVGINEIYAYFALKGEEGFSKRKVLNLLKEDLEKTDDDFEVIYYIARILKSLGSDYKDYHDQFIELLNKQDKEECSSIGRYKIDIFKNHTDIDDEVILYNPNRYLAILGKQ